MTGISTAALYDLLTSNATQAQSAWATANIQESTGLVSTTYSGISDVTSQVLNFQSEYTQNTAWSSNATTAGDRTQAMYTAIGDMSSLLTTFRATLSSAISETAISSSTTSSLATSASSTLSDLASAVNTQFDGRYLFSGTATSTAPVDLTNYPASGTTLSADTADTSYYKGNSTIASVQVGATDTVSYGVTGDNSAIEEALRAVAMVEQTASSGTVDTATLQSAYDLAGTAITDLSNLQAGVSDTASRLTTAETTTTTYASYLQTMADDLTTVDSATAATKVSGMQTILTSSYYALSSVMKVSLASYL